jgi:ankyrin repeat protein
MMMQTIEGVNGMVNHNLTDKQDDIFQVVRNGKVDLYRKNIDKYDINIRNEYGQSLLHEAIAYKQPEIALNLLDRAIDVNIQDKNGQTPLHFISFHPDTVLAEKIIEKGGNLELKDLHGNTPLWYAVFNAKGMYELVKLFMKYHPNPAVKNNAGRSSVDFATQIKDETLLNMLKENL